jgi:oligosaccharide reducing-end xylanase
MTEARARLGSRHRPDLAPAAWLVFALAALTGCSSTLDSLGQDPAQSGTPDGAAPGPLSALSGPTTYDNAFRDLLGRSDADIAAKLSAAFAQLFHGDPATEAIYVPVGTDQAYIQDVYHGDIRTEGIGIAMLVAVELDKRAEFDRLWTYAKAVQQLTTGPARGYFSSVCDETTPCVDPYGMEQFVTALLFASDRWTSAGPSSYASDASSLLDVLENKERENGGVLSGTTSVFDATTGLVREQPVLAVAGYTRSALEIPAMYELWAQASGNAFWNSAAAAARAHLVAAANGATGLWPQRSYFDGAPVPNFDSYAPQGYRTQLNLAADALWGSASAGERALADRLLGFFTVQGLDKYGKSFELDGTVIDGAHELGLVAVNGALAVASTRASRADFVNAVWAMPIPDGDARYYDGILYLVSLLVLSGQYRVY